MRAIHNTHAFLGSKDDFRANITQLNWQKDNPDCCYIATIPSSSHKNRNCTATILVETQVSASCQRIYAFRPNDRHFTASTLACLSNNTFTFTAPRHTNTYCLHSRFRNRIILLHTRPLLPERLHFLVTFPASLSAKQTNSASGSRYLAVSNDKAWVKSERTALLNLITSLEN